MLCTMINVVPFHCVASQHDEQKRSDKSKKPKKVLRVDARHIKVSFVVHSHKQDVLLVLHLFLIGVRRRNCCCSTGVPFQQIFLTQLNC